MTGNRKQKTGNAELFEFEPEAIGACAYAPVGSRKGNVLNFVGCLKFLNLESIKPA